MKRWRSLSVFVLVVSAVYLYALPSASIFYFAAVALHTGVGILFAAGLLLFLFRGLAKESWLARIGWIALAVGTVLGIALIFLGTPHRYNSWLYAHISLCTLGVVFLIFGWLSTQDWLKSGFVRKLVAFAAVVFLIAAVGAGARWTREVSWKNRYRVSNPEISPQTMENEGDGPQGKFFPSSAQTTDGNYIPSSYFLQSQACERCHADIYKQWQSSAHHFSSFNNQWYRKSIEYMQEVDGVKPSKWCAGCHDPARIVELLVHDRRDPSLVGVLYH